MRAAAIFTVIFSTGILMGAERLTRTETATLGGGCFWCLEAVFERLPGVSKVENGYAGGKTLNPTYLEICAGITGHAEVVQIHFDPKKIGYDQILSVFWQCHDPTQKNRQGSHHQHHQGGGAGNGRT